MASKYSVAQSLLVAFLFFSMQEIFFRKEFVLLTCRHESQHFSNNNVQISGRIFLAIFYLLEVSLKYYRYLIVVFLNSLLCQQLFFYLQTHRYKRGISHRDALLPVSSSLLRFFLLVIYHLEG